MSNNNNRNNSNNNNNRRRGRGNNRSQGGGPLNRIDSRARGNAPQMLEKYRKLAQDCSMNGDRVQAEYYLQFADHYFRVIADSRAPKDDQRGPRTDRGEEEEIFEDEFDRGQPRPEPRRREEPPAERSDQPRNDQVRNDRGDQARHEPREEGSAEPRRSEPKRSEPRRADSKRAEPRAESPSAEASSVEGEAYEPAENPFTRPPREKTRRPRRERPEAAATEDSGDRLDPSVLPGAISADMGKFAEESDAAPAPRRALKPRTPRARRKDSDEVEVVS